jgi:RNA-binding protein
MSALPVKNPKALSGAQRSALRGLGHHLRPVVQVGLRGVTPAVVAATAEALHTHELIKLSVGSEAPVDRKEAPAELAAAAGAHLVGVVGRTALLYRRRFDDPAIALPGVFEEAPRPDPAAEAARRAGVVAAARAHAAAAARLEALEDDDVYDEVDDDDDSHDGPGSDR